jgi:hypothetical protein
MHHLSSSNNGLTSAGVCTQLKHCPALSHPALSHAFMFTTFSLFRSIILSETIPAFHPSGYALTATPDFRDLAEYRFSTAPVAWGHKWTINVPIATVVHQTGAVSLGTSPHL